MDKDAILRRIHDVLAPLPALRIAYVYGSFLSRDDFRDIDIALLVDDQQSDGESFLKYAADAGDRIEEALEFRYACDVRVLNDQPVWFGFEIISTGKPLYVRDEDERIEFETQVTVEYQDMKPMYDLFDREYLAQV
jgi:predicted nucleotidyltransferase